jgi:hypothetical protein
LAFTEVQECKLWYVSNLSDTLKAHSIQKGIAPSRAIKLSTNTFFREWLTDPYTGRIGPVKEIFAGGIAGAAHVVRHDGRIAKYSLISLSCPQTLKKLCESRISFTREEDFDFFFEGKFDYKSTEKQRNLGMYRSRRSKSSDNLDLQAYTKERYHVCSEMHLLAPCTFPPLHTSRRVSSMKVKTGRS